MKKSNKLSISLLLSIISTLALIELVAMIENLGFKIIPIKWADIIENMLLAWLTSHLFYFVVVYIPEKKRKNDLTRFSHKHIFYLFNSIEGLKKDIFGNKLIICESDYSAIDSYVKERPKKIEYLDFIKKHILSIIDRTIQLYELFDPTTMKLIDELAFEINMIHTNDEVIILDDLGNELSFGQNNIKAMIRIFEINDQIKRVEKRNIEVVNSEFNKRI